MEKNIYKPVKAIIEKVITETSNIKTFVLKPEVKFLFSTGQFIELAVPGYGEGPFTPSSSPYNTEKMEVTIMNVGRITSKLHSMQPGETVGIRGPYGNGYPVKKFYEKEVLILGGGVGMAPLRSFLLTLLKEQDKFRRIILCYGSKTPEDVVYKELFPEWKKEKKLEILRSVDRASQGWKETEGLVTVLLDKVKVDLKNSVAVVCGPPVMMKFGTFKLIEIGFKPGQIYLSMERNMSCGLGKCGHCGLGKFYCCQDGPVFTYDTIQNIPEVWA